LLRLARLHALHSDYPNELEKSVTTGSRHGGDWFRTTRWTHLLQAKNRDETGIARFGVSKLCESYWRPIYSYLRRSGHSRADAEDLTQGFFEHLLTHDWLRNVQPGNGKFRSFLLKSLKNFCLNAHAKARAQKRGGKDIILPLDELTTEEEQIHAAGSLTPDETFDLSWAESLMQRAIERLRKEYVQGGKGDLFDELKNIVQDERGASYKEIGARLNLSEGAMKTAVHRIRARLARILHLEIAATLSTEDDADEELRYLRDALNR